MITNSPRCSSSFLLAFLLSKLQGPALFSFTSCFSCNIVPKSEGLRNKWLEVAVRHKSRSCAFLLPHAWERVSVFHGSRMYGCVGGFLVLLRENKGGPFEVGPLSRLHRILFHTCQRKKRGGRRACVALHATKGRCELDVP